MNVSKTTRARHRPLSRNVRREHIHSITVETVSHSANVFPTLDASYKRISQYCAFGLRHELHVNSRSRSIICKNVQINKANSIAIASILCNLSAYTQTKCILQVFIIKISCV